jgi:hypothetical protein
MNLRRYLTHGSREQPSFSIFFNLFQSKYSTCNQANSSLALKKPTIKGKSPDVKKTPHPSQLELIKLEKPCDSY